ncbi:MULTISPECIES: DUF924 family protein [Cyanophyceae]|uniref:DUF924 family protein n=1 Tax=Cyanophyceae TaxID=3028117 RepID=UPI0016821C33|nr:MULTISPECIES: DUF924 family protein [Cyanophyceae]MBD1916952.1 DUF924 domain-containing protein [Phormidium sp. FACHB-77]MBD2029803.1 DUF924 domain-containing protein [Phormidium sp. FACHB-322]MBD2050409.1 DUF924 domain-containing protein [Leptolyngbya sp. FACHB-60]
MGRWQEILRFWFGDPEESSSEYGQQRRVWFKKDPVFDGTIRRQFLTDYEQASTGALATWRQKPRSCLALVILLDQFPRNLFRGEARSFATDRVAQDTAYYALAQGYDQQVLPVERIFFYLPLEHSENLADQERSVVLVRSLYATHPEFESTLDYALRHREVIQRFGRFPHRNQILGRETTPDEAEFLRQRGSRF